MNRKLFLPGSVRLTKQVLVILALLFIGYSETIKAQAPLLKFEQQGTRNDSMVWHLTGKITDKGNSGSLGSCTIYFRTSDRKKVIAKVITNADGTFECNLTCLKNQTVNVLLRKSNFLPVELLVFNPASGKLEVMMERDPKSRLWKSDYYGSCPSF